MDRPERGGEAKIVCTWISTSPGSTLSRRKSVLPLLPGETSPGVPGMLTLGLTTPAS